MHQNTTLCGNGLRCYCADQDQTAHSVSLIFDLHCLLPCSMLWLKQLCNNNICCFPTFKVPIAANLKGVCVQHTSKSHSDHPKIWQPRLGGSVVSVSDSWPGGCEFDPRFRRLFFPVYFCLSPLQKYVSKVVGGFGKKSCVSTGVRKPGNTYVSPTAMIWP